MATLLNDLDFHLDTLFVTMLVIVTLAINLLDLFAPIAPIVNIGGSF